MPHVFFVFVLYRLASVRVEVRAGNKDFAKALMAKGKLKRSIEIFRFLTVQSWFISVITGNLPHDTQM